MQHKNPPKGTKGDKRKIPWTPKPVDFIERRKDISRGFHISLENLITKHELLGSLAKTDTKARNIVEGDLAESSKNLIGTLDHLLEHREKYHLTAEHIPALERVKDLLQNPTKNNLIEAVRISCTIGLDKIGPP